ncbi:LADA_0H03686g1_1 [Lachancea dasiensis]|uniref:Beige protein homolog 1 n=1 Tax=Lachancea dasiensis TaxID=1072105 RepID=A0A1G4K0D8_9SACH|nr:LADA_0H03686g1_1 [Lachancea dasiensis]
MTACLKELSKLCSEVLNLQPLASADDYADELPLNEVLLEVLSGFDSQGGSFDSAHISEYVYDSLAAKFANVGEGEDNLWVERTESWKRIFELDFSEIILEFTILAQILLNLSRISFINAQKLGRIPELKDALWGIIAGQENLLEVKCFQQVINELFTQVLNTGCSPLDLQALYEEVKLGSETALNILNTLGSAISDAQSQSFLFFDNHYEKFEVNLLGTKFSIQVWAIFNSVTSNRVFSLNDNLFVEIRQSILCISDDEYVLSMFESFEFSADTLYNVTMNVDNRNVSLHINGTFMETLSLPDKPSDGIRVLELGSMICSFKLFKFWMWSEPLFETSIKLTNDLPLLQLPNTNDHRSIESSFHYDSNVLQNVFENIHTPGMTFGLCVHHTKQLNTRNLLINLNPQDWIDEFGDAKITSLALDANQEFQIQEKLLFYQQPHLLACFEAVNFADLLMELIQHSQELETLYALTEHFVILMDCYQLRNYFEEKVGYEFLGALLSREVIPRLETGLSLPFMSLFLKYCGWNAANPKRSLIRNIEAYGSLVMNFELWISKYFCLDSEKETMVEMVRFLFFQLQEMLESPKHGHFNFQQLSKIQLLEKIIMQLEFSSSTGLPEELIRHVKEEIANVLRVFIKSISKQELSFLFNFAFYEIKEGCEERAAIVLRSFDLAFDGAEDTDEEHKTLFLLESIPIKTLLMMLCDGNSIDVILNSLKILVRFLRSSSARRSRFAKNNGFRVLFNLLKKANYRFFREIVECLLTSASYADHADYGAVSNAGVLFKDNASTPEFHCLTIDLLEWVILDDINASPSLKVTQLLSNYISTLSKLQESAPELSLFDARSTAVPEKLTELLMTLGKPQNMDTYLAEIQQITTLLSNILLHWLTLSNTRAFSDQLLYLARGRGNKVNKHYLEPFYWNTPFLTVLNRFESFIPSFEILFEQTDYILPNFVHLLEVFTSSRNFTDLTLDHYLRSLKVTISCVECFNNLRLKSQEAEVLQTSLSKIALRAIIAFLNVIQRHDCELPLPYVQTFVEVILTHQTVLFGPTKPREMLDLDSSASIFVGLSLFLGQRKAAQFQSTILNCLRVIVLKHEQQLGSLASAIDRSNKNILSEVLVSSISASDEILLDQLTSKEMKAFFEGLARKQYRKLFRREYENAHFSILQSPSEGMKWLLKQRETALEKRYDEINGIFITFKRDGMRTSDTIIATEEKRIHYFCNDREDEFIFFKQRYVEFERRNLNTRRVRKSECIPFEWSLDFTEDASRMRKMLIPHYNVNKNFTNAQKQAEMGPNLPLGDSGEIDHSSNERRASSTISFEIISELDLGHLEIAETSDKNRKVLKMLEKGDTIRRIWNCSSVIGLNITEGVLILSARNIYFMAGFFYSLRESKVIELRLAPTAERDSTIKLISGRSNEENKVDYEHATDRLDISQVSFYLKRPFLLRDLALEIFSLNGKSAFYTFHDKNMRDDIFQLLEKHVKVSDKSSILHDALAEVASKSENIIYKNGLSDNKLSNRVANVFAYTNYSQLSFKALNLWQSGDLSNFYYLMIVNTLAGRTFNDITQYPVFPWVIADYHSDELDLENPLTFRDLSKPMGAQTEPRRSHFIERFEALKELQGEESPFHYGTHYSSAMIVSSYMMRLSPFVDSYLLLQDGKFGHADRLFNSIERAWCSASRENTTDVRELIPEFFYLPDFLINKNAYMLGVLQDGSHVNDVALPRWSKNDPKLFIEKNREALESAYVSEHLNEWIDLVFGYKQTGDEAVNAVNVFNGLSYPGAVNLDKIDDVNERMAVTGIIHNFGQCPLRIFDQPHPKRVNVQLRASTDQLKIGDAPVLLEKKEPSYEGHAACNRVFSRHSFNKCVEDVVTIIVKRSRSLQLGENVLLNAHNSQITCIQSYKSYQIWSGDECGLIKLWCYRADGTTTAIEASYSFIGHLCPIKEIHASDQYNLMLSLDAAGNLFSWDILNMFALRCISRAACHTALNRHTGAICYVDTKGVVSICDLNGSTYATYEEPNIVTAMGFVSFDERGTEIKWFEHEKEIVALGLKNGHIEVVALTEGRKDEAWQISRIKSLKTGASSPIAHIGVRVFGSQESSESRADGALVATNEEGAVFTWE